MSHQSQPPHVDYQALADLRYQVRRFLRTREVAARAAGVAPQQYVLLLQVKGLDGREPPTIRALAERLQTQHHAVVQLVDRLAARDMVARRRDVRDRREVLVALRPAADVTPRRAAAPSGEPVATPVRPAPREFVAIPELRDIHFDFDKYDIRPGDARTLDANAAWLKASASQLLLVEGHCDERGTNEYNVALGDRRAKAAMNYLVAQGVRANRITVISYGEERPLCTEHNEACWSQNRRAHFLVRPQ